ncbi:hypothetical protein C9422_18640 [Pseudomonas sp. B1(2018)]|uniref:hypothetical protein n=1 Tax=Pseudomonas sp. B1(2018) TaxID=2233856 RepID=UPI000D5FC622|nr:hypothetical protein [Pseudomonas sp. B1(2018)]PVZ56542.1 hypothetical protein C9422_18640 [Pseudomonas sp. B1(2018)]
MSHQFKPGDLALTLISGFGFAAMTTVKLDVFLRKGQTAQEPDGCLWTPKFDGWAVYRDDADGAGFFKPEHLMPLRGDFAPEQQKTREVVA